MRLIGLFLVFAWFLSYSGPPAEAVSPYRAYAEKLAGEPPAHVVVRPDLEALLDSLTQGIRLASNRRAISPGPEFKVAARAQAIDMVLGDFVGHKSLKGYSFGARFAAFAEDLDRYPARGENAARERSEGPAGEAKARRLFQQWLDSGGHRRNMLKGSYNRVSTGVVQEGDNLYAVQIFWSEPES